MLSTNVNSPCINCFPLLFAYPAEIVDRRVVLRHQSVNSMNVVH